MYYCIPVWLSILIDSLTKSGLAQELKNCGTNEQGLYKFSTEWGKEIGCEDMLVVWSATASAKAVLDCIKIGLPQNTKLLVAMAEEYAKERNGREETKVCRGILQLLIARAVEIHGLEKPGEVLVINGDFGLIGQLPPSGRLRIGGKVERVEGSTGASLEIASEKCPDLHIRGLAAQLEKGVWTIERASPSCVMPA